MSSRAHPGALVLLGVLAVWISAPAAAAVGVSAAGAWFTQAAWDLGRSCDGVSAEPRENVTGAWVDLGLGAGFSARLETSGVAAEGAGAELSMGEGLSGAVVLDYEPAGGPWRLQAGVGTPSGDELTAPERDLLQMLAEPALGFPVDDPVRGWQFHLSALGGVALQRGLGLYGGAAVEFPTAFEVTPGTELDPGGRLIALTGLEAGDERRGAGLRVTVAFEGSQQAGGEEICSQRTLWGAEVAGRTVWGALRGEGSAQVAATNGLRWPSATELLVDLQSDPAHRWDLAIGLGLDRGAEVTPGWKLRPVIGASYRRFLPEELPYGDAWTYRITPGIELSGGPLLFEAGVGWGQGGWRATCGGVREPSRDISGTALHFAVRWTPAPPSVRPVRAPSR
jgi:hypothetical protein